MPLHPIKSLLPTLFCLTALTAPAFGQAAPETVPGEILVGLRPTTKPMAARAAEIEATLGQIVSAHPRLGAYRIKLAPGMSREAAFTFLRQRQDVAYAEPNYIRHTFVTTNDPSFSLQYGPQKIQADLAWNIWQPQASVTIAIVDTGIDSTHPDLVNKIKLDSTGAVQGYNAITGVTGAALDDYGHGTHCAGIAAAQVDNNVGIAGIAGWTGQTGTTDLSTKLMPVKVLDSTGSGNDSTIADGIDWAADHGAQVISMSFGGGTYSTTLNNAIQYAWQKGCVLVAAAGNSASSALTYPAAYANVLAVAATDSNDTLTGWSNYGSWVAVAAPGDSIVSTTPTYAVSTGWPLNYATLSGTSMATPHVAGEAALLLGMNPSLTNTQIVGYITANVDAYTPFGSNAIAAGGGRINALKALQAASGLSTTASASFLLADTTTQGSWKGVYGKDGYTITSDSGNYPRYASVSANGYTSDIWAKSTTDVRGLQKAASTTDRIAACLYAAGSFTLDINLIDGQTHQVGFYCLDWDKNKRQQTLQVLDADSGAVLSTQSLSAFSNGTYLLWNMHGHVQIRFSKNAGANAVVSGIFFDSGNNGSSPSPSTSASFVGTDTTTQGSWKGVYGNDGDTVSGDSGNYPSYVTVGASGYTTYVWAKSTSDVRGLQKAASTTDRIAGCLYAASSFTLDLNLSDSQVHKVSFYCLDWDTTARQETIQIQDAVTGAALDTETASAFHNGVYLTWNLKGHVKVVFTKTGGANAVMSGMFFN